MPAEARARKSEPHSCPECGAAFDVTYYDDRTGARSQLPMTTTGKVQRRVLRLQEEERAKAAGQ